MIYTYRVRLRRGDGWNVKSESEQIDGKVYAFTYGWRITEEDSNIYVGEVGMIPRDTTYPLSAPLWVATGDLERVD